MSAFKIEGNHKLSGVVSIGGAKNSAVSLIPASILSDEVVISNMPNISDVRDLKDIMNYLGCEFYREGSEVRINSTNLVNRPITLEYTEKLRASYYFMGALLGRFGKVVIALPGGCKIGARPINFHLKAFEKLGASISYDSDSIIIECDRLNGALISFPFPSVGATVNTILAAVKADGVTTINNAAKEPEIGNLIDFLNSMGSRIEGKDTDTIKVYGKTKLFGGKISVIPDRIEAGTYIILGAMVGDNLKVDKINPFHLKSLLNIMKTMNISMDVGSDYVVISKVEDIRPVSVTTEVYPGFPTDLQQPLTALLSLAKGKSIVRETIYENRFQNVSYLNVMGANIDKKGDYIVINGPSKYKGTEVITTDLRAGACLVLAALAASGNTTIKEVKYILRGYENLIDKLTKIGASISLE